MANNVSATTLAVNPGAIEHSEATAFGINPGGWIALAMLVVIAILIWKGAHAAIGRSLDKKIATIREQLDEATKLRQEAEALRAEHQGRQARAEGEARSILDHAHAEAASIVAKAHDDTEALVGRRARMAQDRIEAAERQAIATVRARAASAAAAAAATIIGERMGAEGDKALVDRTIAGLGQRAN